MSDYLKQVEDQLVELTERGAHRRPRPRLDVLAVAGAVVAVAVVAAVLATIGGVAHRTGTASHHRSATVARPNPKPVNKNVATVGPNYTLPGPPSGGPVPHGFGPESFTALGELRWWLLGSAPCSSPPCTSIVRTTDGGRTFVGIPAPRTDRVSQIRFADASNGFAYGPDLWVTHNGGSQWNQVPLPGQVRELATSVGFVYAIVTNGTGVGELMRSPAGADVWTPVPAAGNVSSGLWVHGDDVLVEASTRSAQQLRVSHDAGQSFTTDQVPPSVACRFEEPAPPVVWEPCSTGMLSGIWRSDDDGRVFARVPGNGLPQLPNSAAFGSASATTAVVGYRQLYRTADGGTSWGPVSGATGITWWQYLGFTDPTHGVAIGYVGSQQPGNERLYYTTDGGASYHLVSIG